MQNQVLRVRSFKRRLYPGQLCNIGLRTLTVDLNGRSCGILAGLIPHVRTFMEFDLDKLIVQLSGFNEAKSRSKETWFRRIIERFSLRVDQSVAFTKPSSLYFFWQ